MIISCCKCFSVCLQGVCAVFDLLQVVAVKKSILSRIFVSGAVEEVEIVSIHSLKVHAVEVIQYSLRITLQF